MVIAFSILLVLIIILIGRFYFSKDSGTNIDHTTNSNYYNTNDTGALNSDSLSTNFDTNENNSTSGSDNDYHSNNNEYNNHDSNDFSGSDSTNVD